MELERCERWIFARRLKSLPSQYVPVTCPSALTAGGNTDNDDLRPPPPFSEVRLLCSNESLWPLLTGVTYPCVALLGWWSEFEVELS